MNTEMNLTPTARSVRAAMLFGLLDPPEPPAPTGAPLSVEVRGHWKVEIFDDAASWTCLCKRSEPFLMRPKELQTVTPPSGLWACEVCRDELFNARTKWQRVDAWLERCRYTLRKDACAEREVPFKKNNRLIRRIYERFWKTSLGSENCVKSMCSNEDCINPYHLCLTNTRGTKLTTEAESFLKTCLLAGASTDTALLLLREKHSIELSRRSIQRIRKDLKTSKSSAI